MAVLLQTDMTMRQGVREAAQPGSGAGQCPEKTPAKKCSLSVMESLTAAAVAPEGSRNLNRLCVPQPAAAAQIFTLCIFFTPCAP